MRAIFRKRIGQSLSVSQMTITRDLAGVKHDVKPKSRGGRPREKVRQAEIDKAVAIGLAQGKSLVDAKRIIATSRLFRVMSTTR